MVVRRCNTEVTDLARWTQGRYQIVCSAAARCSRILGQAGIGVGWANLGNGSLVGNRHLGLRHITVKWPDNTRYICIGYQRRDIGCTNSRVMQATRAHIVFWTNTRVNRELYD